MRKTKLIFFIFLGTLSFKSYAISLVCFPFDHSVVQTNQQFNFMGSCKEYKEKNPKGIGCHIFNIDLMPETNEGFLKFGTTYSGNLRTTPSAYILKISDEVLSYDFEIDRKNLKFQKTETMQIKLGNQVLTGYVAIESGECVIDSNAVSKNKI